MDIPGSMNEACAQSALEALAHTSHVVIIRKSKLIVFRLQLTKKISSQLEVITARYKQIIEMNEHAPDLERLPSEELIINTEERDRLRKVFICVIYLLHVEGRRQRSGEISSEN